MCHAKVDDFTLCKSGPETGVLANSESKLQRIVEECDEIEEFDSGIGLLPCAFRGKGMNEAGFFEEDELFMDRTQGASTPVASQRSFTNGKVSERVVLRIDNVPWVSTSPPSLLSRSLTLGMN